MSKYNMIKKIKADTQSDLDVITLRDGKAVGISEDCVCLYACEEDVWTGEINYDIPTIYLDSVISPKRIARDLYSILPETVKSGAVVEGKMSNQYMEILAELDKFLNKGE